MRPTATTPIVGTTNLTKMKNVIMGTKQAVGIVLLSRAIFVKGVFWRAQFVFKWKCVGTTNFNKMNSATMGTNWDVLTALLLQDMSAREVLGRVLVVSRR